MFSLLPPPPPLPPAPPLPPPDRLVLNAPLELKSPFGLKDPLELKFPLEMKAAPFVTDSGSDQPGEFYYWNLTWVSSRQLVLAAVCLFPTATSRSIISTKITYQIWSSERTTPRNFGSFRSIESHSVVQVSRLQIKEREKRWNIYSWHYHSEMKANAVDASVDCLSWFHFYDQCLLNRSYGRQIR